MSESQSKNNNDMISDNVKLILDNADGFYCNYCDLLDYEADCTCDSERHNCAEKDGDSLEYDEVEFTKSNRQKSNRTGK